MAKLEYIQFIRPKKKYQYYIFNACNYWGYIRQYSNFEEVQVKILNSKWPWCMKFTNDLGKKCVFTQTHMYTHTCLYRWMSLYTQIIERREKMRERMREEMCLQKINLVKYL